MDCSSSQVNCWSAWGCRLVWRWVGDLCASSAVSWRLECSAPKTGYSDQTQDWSSAPTAQSSEWVGTTIEWCYGSGWGERARETSICCACIYAFIGWFLYVASLGIKPATFAYWDDALTNWATWPGPLPQTLKQNGNKGDGKWRVSLKKKKKRLWLDHTGCRNLLITVYRFLLIHGSNGFCSL